MRTPRAVQTPFRSRHRRQVQAHALVPRLVLAGQAGFYDPALPDLEPFGRRRGQHYLMQTRGSPFKLLEQGVIDPTG